MSWIQTWIARPPVWRVVGLVVASAIGVWLLRYIPYTWAGWTATNCWPVCFCEAARESFMRQPVNTISNLAFIAVGALIAGTTGKGSFRPNAPNLMRRVAGYRLTYGLGVIAIGLCSIFYHASLTAIGQWVDWLGIYILFAFVVFYNLTRLWPLPHPVFAVGYGATVLGLSVYTYFNIGRRLDIFMDLLLVALVVEGLGRIVRRPQIRSIYLLGALVSLFVGRYVSNQMGGGALCVPTGWVQGHAIWHVLTALATGLLFLYYYSENVQIKDNDEPFSQWTRVKARRP